MPEKEDDLTKFDLDDLIAIAEKIEQEEATKQDGAKLRKLAAKLDSRVSGKPPRGKSFTVAKREDTEGVRGSRTTPKRTRGY